MKANLSSDHYAGKTVAYWHPSEIFMGAGGILSNIIDMTQFLAANMGVVSLKTDVFGECHKRQHVSGEREYIGIGWIISESDQGDIVWHDGITGGFRSFIGFNPQSQKGLVILSNSMTKNWLNDFGFAYLKNGLCRSDIKNDH